MSAPDFYFANNAMFRYIHDQFGRDALIRYWRDLGTEYYRGRTLKWRDGPMADIALDWRTYFEKEPQAEVVVTHDDTSVTLEVQVCPAIKHLRDNNREIVPYFCEHCDQVTGAMAELASCQFSRIGGMGSCRQTITRITVGGKEH
jgi:hypothetical protein